MRADPDVATLPRRALSTVVDGAIMLVVIGAAAGAVGWRSAWSHSDLTRGLERLAKATAWPQRGWTFARRNWRSPGRRVAGTRRVDARTGGPVTVRAVLVEQLAQAGSKRLTRPLIQHVFQSSRERNEAARLRIDEMRRAHGGDAERVQEETMRIYREENVSCVPALLTTLGTACLHLVPALLSPRRQTLIERLAGTVVVKEPRR
jgi:uncharacterized RDD family membrane protein YckC